MNRCAIGVCALWMLITVSACQTSSPATDASVPEEPIAIEQAKARTDKPNVLLILTDDQGWGDIRSHDNEAIYTPNLDGLAASGARFERFFVSPVCAPTRASLLTGRYHMRTGVHGVTRGAENMRAEEVTIAEALKASGYATGIFGKWHNGAHWPHHPNAQGFDEFIGFCAGHWNNYFDTTLEKNGAPHPTKGYITDVLADHAIDFMDRHKNEPFFCYVPFNAPHAPFQVPDKYFDKYKKQGLDDTLACVYGMVENIDDNIGRMMAALEVLGLADNTIVIFLTDNGPNTDRYNGGMRGRKGSVHEGGVRVPSFWRWPNKIPQGLVIKPNAAHIDVLPTLVELTGVQEPATLPLDGQSLAPLLLDQAYNAPDRVLYTYWGGKQAIRTAEMRYVKESSRWSGFDMVKDPEQKRDVVREHAGELAELGHAASIQIRAMIGEGFKPVPAEAGHAGEPVLVLAGHEAFLAPNKGEGISYVGSSGWANDWITNWSKTEAHPWWPLKVVKAGRYRISVDYRCTEAQVGSTLFAQAVPIVEGQPGAPIKTSAVAVTKAHEGADVPSPDRVKRKEVYETTWARLDLGEVDLPVGDMRLDVRVEKIVGDHAPEIKAVRLERVK